MMHYLKIAAVAVASVMIVKAIASKVAPGLVQYI